jgi:hypothetical protein
VTNKLLLTEVLVKAGLDYVTSAMPASAAGRLDIQFSALVLTSTLYFHLGHL